MIKNILIYIAVLAISFSFAVFYYAWFSNFLLIVVGTGSAGGLASHDVARTALYP